MAYRFQVSDTLACCVPGLRAQQTLLLENEARADEDAAKYGEDDTNDLSGVKTGGQLRKSRVIQDRR